MSKIFENALLSIEIGVEDFSSTDSGRHLSAIRNIHAGVLLLCKEVLSQNSPDSDNSLIFKNLVPTKRPDGTVTWTPKGKQTVDRPQIEERFAALGLTLDWKQLKSLANIRNDIEHRYSEEPEHLIKEALADSLPLIIDLISRHLKRSPQEELNKDCWAKLLENKEVYDAEKRLCVNSFDNLKWESKDVASPVGEFRCTECDSDLLMQVDNENTRVSYAEFVCRHCGARPDGNEIISETLASITDIESYIAAKDGGDAPVCDCPECGDYSFIRDIGECVVCEFAIEETCAICGNGINPEDYNPDYPYFCGYHAYTTEKMMSE